PGPVQAGPAAPRPSPALEPRRRPRLPRGPRRRGARCRRSLGAAAAAAAGHRPYPRHPAAGRRRLSPAALPTLWHGATFAPGHLAHLAVARAAAGLVGEPVTLAPAADPPHRAAPGAAAHHRACMLDLAVAGDPLLRVDRR